MRMQARAAEQVPTVPAGSRAAGQREGERAPELPNLREAAHMVLALRKEQGAETRQLDDPAEPCMAALFQLVEDIVYGVPKDLSERILQDADGEIAKLYNLFVDLNRLPQRQDRKRRVRRLLAAMRYVEQLSSLCQYMGPFTRLSFDELHAQILVELWLARSMVRMDTLLRSRHFRQGCLASRCQLLEAQLPTAPRLWLVHWQTLQGLGRLPKAREFQHLTLATAAHQAHGSQAVVLLAVHRWRSANSVDPQNVTWRQLVTFARWYRSRWGQELEVYFWIDSCCVPELRARLPEQEAETKEDIWVTDDEEVDALPTAPEAAAGRRSSFATLMEKRGLSNLAAWSKATGEKLDDQPDAEDEEEIDEAFQELVAAGRKEDADVAGLDAMLPALFAAMDGVVLCNCHDFEQDAWCRLFLSLAYAFLPSGRLIYEVERNLVHISRAMRARQTEAGQEEDAAKKRSEERIELPNALRLEEAEGNRPALAEVAEDSAEAANASVRLRKCLKCLKWRRQSRHSWRSVSTGSSPAPKPIAEKSSCWRLRTGRTSCWSKPRTRAASSGSPQWLWTSPPCAPTRAIGESPSRMARPVPSSAASVAPGRRGPRGRAAACRRRKRRRPAASQRKSFPRPARWH
ncbi:unnamed protein product [Effrenium voratum]|nr:unnamed protein product [Effrenium voratum]